MRSKNQWLCKISCWYELIKQKKEGGRFDKIIKFGEIESPRKENFETGKQNIAFKFLFWQRDSTILR